MYTHTYTVCLSPYLLSHPPGEIYSHWQTQDTPCSNTGKRKPTNCIPHKSIMASRKIQASKELNSGFKIQFLLIKQSDLPRATFMKTVTVLYLKL